VFLTRIRCMARIARIARASWRLFLA